MDISKRLDRLEGIIQSWNREKYTLILSDGNSIRADPPDCINLVLKREDIIDIVGKDGNENGMLLSLLRGLIEA